MRLYFWGAARQVTGSMYLLEMNDGFRLLVDCGMDYEIKKNPVQNQKIFPFEASSIHAVLLTHAHIDHSGNLPILVKEGFKGPIYCTSATADLSAYLLYDSCHIQQGDYIRALARSKKNRRHLVQKPLYSEKHVSDTVKFFERIQLDQSFEPHRGITVQFQEAGHLLGAAGIRIQINENGKTHRFGFTGDLGRKQSKLLRDGIPFENIDYLISEGTYGGRKHLNKNTPEQELASYITATCVTQRGKLIIPAFSVGRTQSIVFTIHQLKASGIIPASLKVFVDSPLAIKSTPVYDKHPELLNKEALDFKHKHGALFEHEHTHYLDTKNAHEALAVYYDPCIIISAAGMVEGGRIQEHVMNHIEHPTATILIAGFCAEGTLGYRLLLGQPTIRIKDKDKRVHARIAKIDVFSSHPDHDEILEFIYACQPKQLKTVFLIHGELPQLEALKSAVLQIGSNTVEIPKQGQFYEFN